MRKTILLLAVFMLGAGTAVYRGLAQQPAAQTKQPAARPPLTIEKVKDDLYVIIGNGGNVGVLVTDEGVVLVDDKFEQDYEAIIQQVRSVTNQPVKYVINTHHHGDHTGGNQRFIALAEIISHKNARANIVASNKGNASPLQPARIAFTDETSIFLGGKEVQARYFGRGHTNGDIVVYFPAQRVLHMGDLMAGATPLIDYNGGGSLIEWTKTVDAAMAAFEIDTVIPGHGTVTNRAGLQTYRDNVVQMRSEITNLIRQGRNKDDVRAFLAGKYPAAYANPGSLNNQWALPGFMTELK